MYVYIPATNNLNLKTPLIKMATQTTKSLGKSKMKMCGTLMEKIIRPLIQIIRRYTSVYE